MNLITTTTKSSPGEMLEQVSSTEVITIESSSNTAPADGSTLAESSSAVEHEEGEIDDDDDEEEMGVGGNVVLEYEDISSEEEFTIRERLAQLEARNAELGLLSGINGRASAETRNAYDKQAVINANEENYECISDEEDIELYVHRNEPIPKPKLLPARRKLRSLRSKRPTVGTAYQRHERSTKKLERRKREQLERKATVHRRHKRRKQHSSNMVVNIDTSDSEVDFPLDRARLQAACAISGRKRKTDKENWDALKEKLKLSMQKRKKSNDIVKESGAELVLDEPMVLVDDEEEEEDEEVLQLRLQALKSKVEVKESGVIGLLEEPLASEKTVDEQELRMIALQSAFTKKHQIRLQKKQEERPYSPSDEIRLLSPVRDFPPTIEELAEIVEDEDDVQIIETRPETVEINDSSSDEENRMQISASVSPQCPEPSDIQPVDMELASSEASLSPVHSTKKNQQSTEEKSAELEPPPPPMINDWHSELPAEDDEEALRNQLLSKFSVTAQKESIPPAETRPMTPDSMGEEEADALRELILSKMKLKKVSKPQEPIVAETRQTIANLGPIDNVNIPEKQSHDCSASAADSSSINHGGVSTGAPVMSAANAVANNVSHSRLLSNPNLITLIGKQKANRKKRKKSLSANATKKVAATAPLAIAVPPPSRSLVKAPVAEVPVLSIAKPQMKITKLVNNPNKLINRSRPTAPIALRERSTTVESYVQKPVAKLIIQVGNSASDSDSDYYPSADPEPECEVERIGETLLRDLDNASPSRVTIESPVYSPAPPTGTEMEVDTAASGNNNGIAPASKTDESAFEQRLDQFLKTVRNKIDQCQNGRGVIVRTPTSQPAGSSSGPTAPARRPAAPSTPAAVRHLPKSAQMEYKVLLARMAQLEKQKQARIAAQSRRSQSSRPLLTRTFVNTDAVVDRNSDTLVVTVNRDGRDVIDKCNSSSMAAPLSQSNQTVLSTRRDSDTLVRRVLINNTVVAGVSSITTGNVTPSDVNHDAKQPSTNPPMVEANSNQTETLDRMKPKDDDTLGLDNLEKMSLQNTLKRIKSIREEERARVLATVEKHFERHSQKFGRELQDLIVNVENAQHEREKQYGLENKIDFLKEKLSVYERALSLLKQKLGRLFPALHESHNKVMTSRKRSIELSKMCLAIGRQVKGPSYDVPANDGIRKQLKVLTSETKRLKNMTKLSLEEFKRKTDEQRQRQRELLHQRASENPLVVSEVSVSQSVDQSSIQTERSNEPVALDMQSTNVEKESKPLAKSAPASRSASPVDSQEHNSSAVAAQEAPAVLSCEGRLPFGKYQSPLASLKNQSAQKVPDGIICPYQMRGQCVDRECKFEHFQ
ncbi:uncharacterized protein LOC129767721 [Toxorhynchites rutilus septentrionalis]|uniref:uncharacterized protein LOC129767721 n=1 Tax=Toxorhynchites rutilus septentrionalis TaxID=329112 RepID=UPI00247895CA|nr:uncharacterized protein LOC129767721 [Toxorhynchites rutilus septentrionalis]